MASNAYVSVLPTFDDEANSVRMDVRVVPNDGEHLQGASLAAEIDRDISSEPRPQPTTELLMPDMAVFKDRFSLLVSRHAFDGWVLQPSPCCGAASVAGAANAALGLPHDAPAALSHTHVAALYFAMLTDQAHKRSSAVARLLGINSIEPALEALRAALRADEKSLGGRREHGCKPKEALLRLRTICEEREHTGVSPTNENSCNVVTGVEVQMWLALREVLQPMGGASTARECEEGEDEDETVVDSSLCCDARAGKSGGFGTKVCAELKVLFTKLSGIEQLAPSVERPMTWSIGNWGMHAAVRALRGPAFDDIDNDTAGVDADHRLVSLRGDGAESERAALCRLLRSRTLVGQRCKGQAAPPPIQVRKTDDEVAIEAAWVALKGAFSQSRTCLILHQKGHYALIFAMREWVEHGDATGGRPRRVRELLTCRKGQRPTLWVDWVEVHSYICGWSGYAIIEVSAVTLSEGEM